MESELPFKALLIFGNWRKFEEDTHCNTGSEAPQYSKEEETSHMPKDMLGKGQFTAITAYGLGMLPVTGQGIYSFVDLFDKCAT